MLNGFTYVTFACNCVCNFVNVAHFLYTYIGYLYHQILYCFQDLEDSQNN